MFAQNTRSRFEVLSSDQSSEKGTFDSSYDFLHGGLQEKKTTYATRAEASPQPYEKAQAHRSPGFFYDDGNSNLAVRAARVCIR